MHEGQKHPTIVCLDRNGIPERIQIPKPAAPHHWVNYKQTAPEDVIKRSIDADILVVNKIKIDAAILGACPKLRHIVVSATGYNIIDINACEKRGVSVSHVPSYAATTVAEHVIGTAISLRREIPTYAQTVVDGKWQLSDNFCVFDKPFNNIEGATIGLVGMGEIAKATAKKAHALGLNVLFTSRSKQRHSFARQVDLSQLLGESDIVSVHCSLNKTTQGMLGKREIALMPKHGILINTARGGIVDETAAVDAIRNGTIAGLAFDVMAEEPPRDDAPLLSIADRTNVIITPHISWASEQAMQYLANTVSRNVDAYLNGKPINLVTAD